MRRSPDAEDYQTKSELKRVAEKALALAKALSELNATRLADLDLDERTLELVQKCQRITQHVAHKREVQYLAKHLREIDTHDWTERVFAQSESSRQDTAQHHRLEALREQLIDGGDEALNALIQAQPGLDRQRLRQLVKQVIKERASNAPPRAYREIFQLLKAAASG
jgi:ribosome-associated protein